MSRRKLIALVSILAVVGIAGVVVAIALRPKENASRREWKTAAIADIQRVFADKAALDGLLDPIRQETSKPHPRFGAWVTPGAAIMADGKWLVFKNNWTHRDATIGDIWLAKASNGNWYYSTYHFCSGMNVLAMENQPASLDEFISLYFVRPFDGTPGKVLESTWDPSGGFR